MSILKQLSSQIGARNAEPNHKVAVLCIADSTLLDDIATGLREKDRAVRLQ
ncbi:hypothetical protein QUF64_02355 [Anaerolineales bacterium HSG6]|nr:hypothetical protein [Anaerolineales bacterium HSG6]